MKELKKNGKYTLAEEDFAKIKENFYGYYCDEENTKNTIKYTFENHNYLIDTHTAVGYSCALQYLNETGSKTKIILASTASPFKFAGDVYKAVSGKEPQDELSALNELSEISKEPIPKPLDKIGERQIRFSDVCKPYDMKKTVLEFSQK